MTDFINKVISVILIFVMLILAPIMISYKTEEMIAKREILNDVDTLVKKIQENPKKYIKISVFQQPEIDKNLDFIILELFKKRNSA